MERTGLGRDTWRSQDLGATQEGDEIQEGHMEGIRPGRDTGRGQGLGGAHWGTRSHEERHRERLTEGTGFGRVMWRTTCWWQDPGRTQGGIYGGDLEEAQEGDGTQEGRVEGTEPGRDP